MRIKQSLLISLAAVLLLVTAVTAQDPEQAYDLSWWTVDGGGGRSADGSYALEGTSGQPDVGPSMSGEGYTLEGGFWGGGLSGVSWYSIYLPLVQRND